MTITKMSRLFFFFLYRSCTIVMSSFSSLFRSFSSLLLGNGEHRFKCFPSKMNLLPTLQSHVGSLGEHPTNTELTHKDYPSPPTAISLQDYLRVSSNLLAKSSSSSLLLDSYSLGSLVSCQWELSLANLMCRPFMSISMLPIDIVEALN